MAPQSQFILISYDISNDKKRLKAMKALEGYGAHVQYSVFECRLKDNQITQLRAILKPLVGRDDSIRLYFINSSDISRIEIIGSGKVLEDKPFYMH